MADWRIPEIPASDGATLFALEAELEAMKRRIVEIGNVANRARITDRALAVERKIHLFQVVFVDVMASRLSPQEHSIWEKLRHGRLPSD